MGKKIVLAVFGGIVAFGVVLALVGVLLGGQMGNFGAQDGHIVYTENGQQIQLASTPRWIENIPSWHWGSRWSDRWDSDTDAETGTRVSGNTPAPLTAGELQHLDIEVGAGFVVVETGADFGLSVDGPMEYSTDFENGTWSLYAYPPNNITPRGMGWDNRFWHNGQDITTTFTFTVPAGFNSLDLQIDMGQARVSGLTLTELECEVGMGGIELNDVTAEDAALTADMGSITATGFTAGNSELTCAMGSIDLAGSVSGHFTANCDMGGIKASLARPGDYGWTAQADLGSINLDGHNTSGMDSSSNGGSSTAQNYFDLTCGMGTIDITFQ